MRKIAINLETQKRNASRSLPVIIFIFESQAGVWSRVELRHEFGPNYKFHIHNL